MTVATDGIIERLDVLGNLLRREFSALEYPFLDTLLFQTPEERLGDCIVPAIAPTTHAGLEPICAAEAAPMLERRSSPPRGSRARTPRPYSEGTACAGACGGDGQGAA